MPPKRNEQPPPPSLEDIVRQSQEELQNKILEVEGLKSKIKTFLAYKEAYEKLKQEHEAFKEELKQRESETVS